MAAEDAVLPGDLLAYETARAALSTYAVESRYENAVVVETISLGTAVSLLNDLDWYLSRVLDDALVREPSVSGDEWLSRALATEIRDGRVAPDEVSDRLKVYGVADGRLVEPMYATRVAGSVPDYDLREVESTVVVRVTPGEFS